MIAEVPFVEIKQYLIIRVRINSKEESKRVLVVCQIVQSYPFLSNKRRRVDWSDVCLGVGRRGNIRHTWIPVYKVALWGTERRRERGLCELSRLQFRNSTRNSVERCRMQSCQEIHMRKRCVRVRCTDSHDLLIQAENVRLLAIKWAFPETAARIKTEI